MRIVNDRYRIVDLLGQNRAYSIYEAVDMTDCLKKVNICILNSGLIEDSLLKKCISKFEKATVNNRGETIELIDFGVIKNRNSKTKNKNYFYVTEYTGKYKLLVDYVENISEENLINTFVEICKSAYDQRYSYYRILPFQIENIYVTEDSKIKLKDEITNLLECNEMGLCTCYSTNIDENMDDRANKLLEHKYYINQLIQILVMMALSNKMKSRDFTGYKNVINQIVYGDVEKYKVLFGKNLYKLISCLYETYSKDRFNTILEILEKVNDIYNTNYTYELSNEVGTLNFDIPLIGREEEVNLINKYISNTFKRHSGKNVILVHGEIGIGKTRLLDHINYLAGSEDNLDCTYIAGKRDGSYKSIINKLIKNIKANADKNLINKYKKEILNLNFDEYDDHNNEIIKSQSLDNKSKLIMVVRLVSLLEEYYSDKNGLVIIDNIDRFDEFTLIILEYVLNRNNIDGKLVVILSYRDGDCLKNEKFTKLQENINNKVSLSIHLRPLPEDKCVEMLKSVMNVYDISNEFVNNFYRYSMGNPLFIEATLKDLIRRKKIYIDKDIGRWQRQENPRIYMPTNMEEICKSQLKDIDGFSYEVVCSMAFFNMPVSIEILSELLDTADNILIDGTIEELLNRGVLYSSISDIGFVYTFYNKFLKSYLYQQVSKNERIRYHEKIYKILVKHCERDNNTYIEEIIYHLEKLDNKDILIDYYKKNEERLEKINSRQEAIKCNLKILKVIEEDSNKNKFTEDEVEANIKLGRLYNESSDKGSSIEYYKIAKKLCLDNRLLVECIDILDEMVWIYMDKGNEDEAENYAAEMNKLLNECNYIQGKLKYAKILIRNAYNNQDFEKVKKLCNDAIYMCGEEYIEYKVNFSNGYCDALICQGQAEHALKKLKAMLEECNNNDVNYVRECIRLCSSIGIIYTDYIQWGEEGLKWFKKGYDLSILGTRHSYSINSLTNLGFANYALLNYDSAYLNFNESSKMAMKEGLIYDNFYNYTYMGTIMYKTGNYTEAFKYAKLCDSYMNNNSMFGQELLPYHIFEYYINDLLGKRDIATEFLSSGIKIFNHTNSIMQHKVELLNGINNVLIDSNSTTIQDVIGIGKKILYTDLRVSMMCEGILKMMDEKKVVQARYLYQYVNTLKDSVKNNENKLTIDYIGCSLVNEPSIEELSENLEKYGEIKNPNILWRIYLELGRREYENSNYTYALIYLSEACDLILELLTQIPKGNKAKFVNKNEDMLNAYEMLLELKQYYNGGCYEQIQIAGVKADENIEDIFQIIIESDFINDKFINTVKEAKWPCLDDINNIDDLLNNLSGSMNENIELICKYITYICLSSRTSIIIEQDNKFLLLASSDGSTELPEDMSIINISRNRGTGIRINKKIISDEQGNSLSYETENKIKSAMCIPITLISRTKSDISKYDYNHDVLGYIYVESDRKLNNINEETMKKCITISRILYMIIDKNNIKSNSTIDELTSTLTRKHLEIFIREQIDRSLNLNSEFSTIMMDIDLFKEVNDTFGHRTGDIVLQKLCNVVLNNIRHEDVVGRYGGEEFFIVLPNTNLNDAYDIAERIRCKIWEAKLMGDKRQVTVSLGVSNYPLHANTYEELIEKTDQALYAAKKGGRNTTNIWKESYGSKISTTNKLSGILVGNGNQDYKNVSTIIEFLDMINEEKSNEEKISSAINRIAEITDCDGCALFIREDGKIINKYFRNTKDVESNIYNYKKLQLAIEKEENICGLDWDSIEDYQYDSIPELQSNMIILLKSKNKIIGAIYLVVNINNKEFTYDELNFVNNLGKIIVPIIQS